MKRKIFVTLGVAFLGLIPILIFGINSIPAAFFGNKMTEIGLAECLKKIPISSDDVIVSGRSEIAAAAWALKRSDLIVLGKPGELEYGFKNYPEYAAKHYPDDALPELIARTRPRHLVGVFTWNLRKKPLPAEWLNAEHTESNGVVIVRF